MSLEIIFTTTGNEQGIFDPSEGCLNPNSNWTFPGYILRIPRNLNDCGNCFPLFTRPDGLTSPARCNVLWRFSMWIETSTGIYVNGTYTGDGNYGNAVTLGSSTFKSWNVFIYLEPCVEYKIIQKIEFCDQQGNIEEVINEIPILRCSTSNNCYTLTPCSEEYPVLFISNNFEYYLNQIIKFRFIFELEGAEDICYLVTQSENCCNHRDIIGYDINGQIVDFYEILGTFGTCESCEEENVPSTCWDIELCDNVNVVNPDNPEDILTLYPAGTILKTTDDLSNLNGSFVKIKFEYCIIYGQLKVCFIDVTVCAKITQSNLCINSVPLNDLIPYPPFDPGTKTVTVIEGLFTTCGCEELTPPTPFTPSPKPSCIYKPVCSINQIKSVLCEFAENIYNKMLAKRYGIKNCCPKNEEKLLIKKEQIDIAKKYDSRYCNDCEDCV